MMMTHKLLLTILCCGLVAACDRPEDPEEESDELLASAEAGVQELGAESVEAVLASQRSGIDACIGGAREVNQYSTGQLSLRFHVAEDGRVVDVAVVDDEAGNPLLTSCLGQRARAWQFPISEDGLPREFVHTFVLDPAPANPGGPTPHLSWTAVEAAVDGQRLAMADCLYSEIVPGAHSVTAHIRVEPDGTTRNTTITTTTLRETAERDCVLTHLRELRFPRFKASTAVEFDHVAYLVPIGDLWGTQARNLDATPSEPRAGR